MENYAKQRKYKIQNTKYKIQKTKDKRQKTKDPYTVIPLYRYSQQPATSERFNQFSLCIPCSP